MGRAKSLGLERRCGIAKGIAVPIGTFDPRGPRTITPPRNGGWAAISPGGNGRGGRTIPPRSPRRNAHASGPRAFVRFGGVQIATPPPDESQQIIEFAKLQDAATVMDSFMQEYDPVKASHRKKTASGADCAMIRPWIRSTMQWLGQI